MITDKTITFNKKQGESINYFKGEVFMLKTERQELILSRVEQYGKVLVNDLNDELNVSEDTIRKDLQELSKAKLVKRVHGGAIRIDNSIVAFEQRIRTKSEDKREIALLALPFIEDGQVIFIDSGTTNLSLSDLLPTDLNATVVTNSPSIALNLCDNPNVDIQLLPGELNKHSRVLYGSSTVEAIKNIHFDLCILGISSIDINKGINVPSLEESILKKHAMIQSSQTLSIVTAEKIGSTSTYFVAKATDLDIMITEKSITSELINPYISSGIQVIN